VIRARISVSVLLEGNHVQLLRINGPAGPLHWITVNGTHRTHALRIIGAPLMAAKVDVKPVPLWLTARSPGWTERVWRGLLNRGLVEGAIATGPWGPVLEVHRTTVPWVLLNTEEAAKIGATYARVYPGALEACGIPLSVLKHGSAWYRWVTTD
jgi:hypothetical protein